MDLEKLFEGVDLTDEVKVALGAKVTEAVNGEVSGLKHKVDELLNEKKTAAQAAKDADEARKAAELEAAKKSGAVEEVEARLNEQYAGKQSDLEAKIKALQGRELSQAKSAAVEQFKSQGIDPNVLGLLAGNLIDTSHNEQGEVVTTYKGMDGSAIGTNFDDFMTYARKDESLSKFIKGNESSGGGANGGSKPTGGASKATERDQKVAEINAKFQ